MACCAVRAPSPAKEPVPAPTKDDNRDGRTTTLALSSTKSLTGDRGQGLLFAQAANEDNRSLADATLQTKHVRIDA